MTPRSCSIANALEIVGERWSLLALREVFFGNTRFDQIAANTGASRDVLTARLKKLVTAGVLEKVQYSAHPPRHEYHLTEAGKELFPVMLALYQWGDKWAVDAPALTRRHTCGEPLEVDLVCHHCGNPVTRDTIHAELADA